MLGLVKVRQCGCLVVFSPEGLADICQNFVIPEVGVILSISQKNGYARARGFGIASQIRASPPALPGRRSQDTDFVRIWLNFCPGFPVRSRGAGNALETPDEAKTRMGQPYR
jgi:hypothetical protein